MVVIQNEELKLSQIQEKDAEFVYELCNSAPYIEYIGDRGIHSIELAKKYIREKYQPSYTETGFGNLKITYQHQDIGTVGLFKREGLSIPDFGFALLPSYHGKGIGFKASQLLLKFIKENNVAEEISAITLPNNTACIHLLNKLGFTNAGTVLLENIYPNPFNYYILSIKH